jgi:hypothetical protein
MPDQPHIWVRAGKGIRLLLIPELGKLKGVLGKWMAGTKGGVEPLTCTHI